MISNTPPGTSPDPSTKTHDEYFRLLVDSTRDYAMFTVDANGRFNSWNIGAERVLGYTEAAVLGQPFSLIFTAEDEARGVPAQEMQTALAAGRAEDERWHLRKNGSRFWASGILALLTDAAGNAIGFAKILRDLTAQQLHEEALERANGQLEERVTQRTAELTTSMDARRDLLRRLVNSQEVERAHISRELHDVTGQTITALSLELGTLKAMPLAPPEAVRSVAALAELVQELAKQTHQLSFALRPTALDVQGLETALENHCTRWGERNHQFVDLQCVGLSVGFTDLPLPPLSSEIETTIYRMVQEALTNISRHVPHIQSVQQAIQAEDGVSNGVNNGAIKISVLVQRGPGQVQAIVEDDGPGFDVDAMWNTPPANRRLGLFGMQERAAFVGGTLNIESAPGEGTSVVLRIPFDKE